MNLTDNDTIKALECCGESKQIGCTHCPVSEDCMNGRLDICTLTLDLIKRKQAVNKLQAKQIVELKIKVEQQKAEIERLQKAIEVQDIMIEQQDYKLKTAKAESIKEFEKKSEKILIELYEKYHKIANKPKKETDMFYQGRAEAIWECIITNRNLVKEMVGEKAPSSSSSSA